MGTLNAQFDPTEEQVKVSARISPTTRKEIQQQNQFNAKATHEAKKNQILQPQAVNNAMPVDFKDLFSKNEMKILHNFFHNELVIKADLKDSLKVLSDLFKEMNLPPILERRIIESFLYANETVSASFETINLTYSQMCLDRTTLNGTRSYR